LKITCPACAAKYSIADEKVQDRLAKIRCRKCGTTIVIDGRVSPAQIYAADGGGASQTAESAASSADDAVAHGGSEYSVDFGEGDQRTMALNAIVEAYNGGAVTAETYVWADGMADWTQLGEVAEIVDALHAAANAPAAAPESAPAQAAAASSSPWSHRESAPSAGRAAVSPASTQARTDLFGGYASAGSEEDVTTSLPQETTAPAGAHTGARNESSVLFSLSALTASAGASSPTAAPAPTPMAMMTPTSSSRDAEDSGLIDLAALTAGASASKGADDSGMFGAPFTLTAPLAAPLPSPVAAAPLDTGPLEYPKGTSKGPYVIGGAIVLAALVISAVFLLRPEPVAPAPVPYIPTAAPAPTPVPEPTAQPTATPPATGVVAEAAPDAGKRAPVSGTRSGGGRRRAPSGTTGGKTGTQGGTEPKPPGGTPTSRPASKCGCATGDLKCAMRCAAKGG
jgi:predicted Zn finger-like uncharacterized protein